MDIDIELGPASELHDYYMLDVFTDTPLEGNGLAVFADGAAFESTTMQRIARELNLSETVFVLPAEQGGDARARIFTPASELPFAGHPTLGTAVLIATATSRDHVRLETGSGIIPVSLERSGGGAMFGRMEQPIPTWAPYARSQELLDALGVERSGLPILAYTTGPVLVSVVLEREQEVAALAPRHGAARRARTDRLPASSRRSRDRVRPGSHATSCRAWGSTRTRRQAAPPVRSPCISRATG